jgi:hypothetical protein
MCTSQYRLSVLIELGKGRMGMLKCIKRWLNCQWLRYNESMKKQAEFGLKAERRESKNRPRMHIHGQNLKRPSRHAGKAIIKKRK